MRYQEELDGADIKAILNKQKKMENGRETSKSHSPEPPLNFTNVISFILYNNSSDRN